MERGHELAGITNLEVEYFYYGTAQKDADLDPGSKNLRLARIAETLLDYRADVTVINEWNGQGIKGVDVATAMKMRARKNPCFIMAWYNPSDKFKGVGGWNQPWSIKDGAPAIIKALEMSQAP
jgi:hypothetical protein